MALSISWEFGVLPERVTGCGNEWKIEPLEEFEEAVSDWNNSANPQGWVLPPVIHSVRQERTLEGGWVEDEIPNTRRTAEHWKLPPTHRLRHTGEGSIDEDQLKQTIAFFVIQCVGCLFGCELQFSDWGVKGRKRARPLGYFVPYGNALDVALEVLPRWYQRQDKRIQKIMTSSLYLHNHSESYEFSWERFLWQFLAFEGCWHIAQKVHGVRRNNETRFEAFAKHFGLVIERDEFVRWNDIRNELVHEVTWGKEVPGYGGEEQPWNATIFLSNFTTVALLSVMSFDPRSLVANWNTRSRRPLILPQT